MLCPVIPCVLGYAPVPIVACAHAVTAGDDPVIALRYTTDSPIRRLRFGHASPQCCRTFHPPPSITNVTTTFGGVSNRGDPGRTLPSGARKSSNPIIDAIVGARSASETRSVESDGVSASPLQIAIGTRSRYSQGSAWLERGSRCSKVFDSPA